MDVSDTVVTPHKLGCNPGQDLLSCDHRQLFEIVDYVILCNVIGVSGIAGNIINIVVFYRQGFTNTANISFFGLAISDLCCLVTLLWVCMCINPLMTTVGVPWVPEDFMYLPGAWPHLVCGRITSYITVFITAERCLSIITPLKIKHLITPKRTAVVICIIYVANCLILVPEYATSYLHFKFFPERNATLLAMSFTYSRGQVAGLVFILNSMTGISSFLGVVIWTIILVIKLQQSTRWRRGASKGAESMSSKRDTKTVKMVVVIASVLIICYTPGSIVALATFIEPELFLGRSYVNLGSAMWSVAFVFQSVNSSVNIFLYYNMSSNYRQTFHELTRTMYRHNNTDTVCHGSTRSQQQQQRHSLIQSFF